MAERRCTGCWAMAVGGCLLLAGPADVGAQEVPMQVYWEESDVPCAYETFDTVRGSVTARSLREYVALRDAALGALAEELGAEAVLLPQGTREPGRDGVGFPVSRADGVPQPVERRISGNAIRFGEGCWLTDPLTEGQVFEGTVVYEVTRNGEVAPPATHRIQGARFHQDIQGPAGAMTLVVDEVSRTALMSQAGVDRATPVNIPSVSLSPIRVTELDETTTIAELECRMLLVEVDVTSVEVCAASGLGVTSGGVMPAEIGVGALAEAFPDGFLPLRVVGESMRVAFEIRAVSVETGPVDDMLFEPLAARTRTR